MNALVVALAARPEEEARLWTRLLRAVIWGDRRQPVWLNTIREVNIIVELGLANFGSPDLIVVAECQDTCHVVFIEAKVVSYVDSAVADVPGAAREKGYFSTVNAQLSLRYRFAHALAEWDGRAGEVIEPARLHAAYVDRVGDPHTAPRHVMNATSLERAAHRQVHLR
ncbi:MAG: hypothetical protein JW940_10405 [Polyangiaceae bacterium]|nr:hypothetical protein [Polyangiaceae bacterium]